MEGPAGYRLISYSGQERHLLGTRLMARRGRSTRTVRMAERLTLCPSREYSIMLGEQRCSGREEPRGLHLSPSPTAPWGHQRVHPVKPEPLSGLSLEVVPGIPKHTKPSCIPRHDNEEVQPVPGVTQVAFLPKQPQSHHLDNHLHSKEGKDEIIKGLEERGSE